MMIILHDNYSKLYLSAPTHILLCSGLWKLNNLGFGGMAGGVMRSYSHTNHTTSIRKSYSWGIVLLPSTISTRLLAWSLVKNPRPKEKRKTNRVWFSVQVLRHAMPANHCFHLLHFWLDHFMIIVMTHSKQDHLENKMANKSLKMFKCKS